MINPVRAVGSWLDERTGFSTTVKPIIEHPVAPTGWDYTIGSATLAAFIVQVVTGVALAFSYVPAPNSAYESLDFITHQAILGSVVRGIHFWGASAMVLLVCMHAAQVFLIGAFKYPREVNWLTGTVLLIFTFGMAFTGQLLRWNQDAYWAVVVGAAQASRAPFIGNWLTGALFAGGTVGGATLTRFYATHVFMIPAVMFGLLGIHLFLVLFHGVSEPPVPGEPVDRRTYHARYKAIIHRVGVPFWPDAAWKDVVFALAVGAVVIGLAIIFGPPDLGNKADPTIIQAYPRPDWYLLWYFALLALVPPIIEDWFIILFPLLLGLLFIMLPFVAPFGERSARRRPWAIAVVGIFAVTIPVLVFEGAVAPWSPVQAATLPASVTQSLSGNAAQGAQSYQQRGCINCHLIAGAGGQRGPELTHIGSQRSPDYLTWRILNGGTNMPAYGNTLSPEELSNIVQFLSAQK